MFDDSSLNNPPKLSSCLLIQDLDFDPPVPSVQPVPAESIPQLIAANKAQLQARSKKEKIKAELMKTQRGFCEEGAEGDNY